MRTMIIVPLGNGRYQINGEDVFAPNIEVAKDRFADNHKEYLNDVMLLRKEKNSKIMQNHLSAKIAG